jgi:hypothetical protein
MTGFTGALPVSPSVLTGASGMEIVNGYICMNCCDVDKARLGQDPHQSSDQSKKQIERYLDKLAAGNFGPAVTFGGSLQAQDSGSPSRTAAGDQSAPASAPAGDASAPPGFSILV